MTLETIQNLITIKMAMPSAVQSILDAGASLGQQTDGIKTLAVKIIPWGQILAAAGLGYKAWEEFNGTGSLTDKIKAALPYLGALLLAFLAGEIAKGYLESAG